MPSSGRHVNRTVGVKARILATAITITFTITLTFPLSPSQARVAAEQTRPDVSPVVNFFRPLTDHPAKRSKGLTDQRVETPSERAARVQHLRLCPRRLQLYSQESFTLVPLPLDGNRETVHGAAMSWSSSDSKVATVTSYGDVAAISPGHALITVQVGSKRANVTVSVEAGVRPKISDQESDRLHAHDCDDPEEAQLNEPPPDRLQNRAIVAQSKHCPSKLRLGRLRRANILSRPC